MSKAAIVFLISWSFVSAAAASNLSGIYNTGVSEVETGDTASLDIEFHPCREDSLRTCGTIVAVHEPDGPSGRDRLPNGEPLLGYEIVKNLKYVGDGQYKRGRINAIDESLSKGAMVFYGLRILDKDNGLLTARGCLAFFCPREMTWTRVNPSQE